MVLRGLSILRIRSCIQSLHHVSAPIETIHRGIEYGIFVHERQADRRFDGCVSGMRLARADASGSGSAFVQGFCERSVPGLH